MTEPKWLVLVNRAAGRRPIEPAVVARALAAVGVEADIEVPPSVAEMGDRIAMMAAAGHTHLAVVGGDGTANLAVNSILNVEWPRPPTLGLLPGGTGCDLLRTFGIPQRLEDAAIHLAGANTYRIDVGRLDGAWGSRYFVNVAQAGVGAAAAETAPRLGRGWGKVRYPMAFLARLPGFRGGGVDLELTDDERVRTHRGEALAVIFANGQFFAGGWNVAPRTNLADGRLDLQIFDCTKARAVTLVPKIIRGVHLTDRAVRRYSTAGFRLETEHSWPIEADGDLVGNTPVSVSVLPGALELKI